MTRFKRELSKNAGDGDCVDVVITIPYKWKYRITESKTSPNLTVERYEGEVSMTSSVFNIINNKLEDELMTEETKIKVENEKEYEDLGIKNSEELEEDNNKIDILDNEEESESKNPFEYEEIHTESDGIDATTILRLKDYLNFKENSLKELREIDAKKKEIFNRIKAQNEDFIKTGMTNSGMDFRDVSDTDIRELYQLYKDLETIISSKHHVQDLTKGVQVKDTNLNELLDFFSAFFMKSTASEENDIRQRIDSIIYKYTSAYEEKRAEAAYHKKCSHEDHSEDFFQDYGDEDFSNPGSTYKDS